MLALQSVIKAADWSKFARHLVLRSSTGRKRLPFGCLKAPHFNHEIVVKWGGASRCGQAVLGIISVDMAFPELVDSLRTMIVSHKEHDEDGFRRGAEAIIRSLSVQNRPSEARSLRDALKVTKLGSPRESQPAAATNVSISVLTRQTPGLVAFVPPRGDRHLVFQQQTSHSINGIVEEYRKSGKLAEAGLSPRRKLLFWGPPGCGKTATAQWLAYELGIPCGIVRLGSLITSYVGETGSNIQRVLQIANQTPMVLLIDEADAIAKSRDDVNDVGELRRVVNALLQGLDAFTSNQSIVILSSNHTHLFDSALWRRFDDVVEFPLPSERERLELLRHLTNGIKLKGTLNSVAKKMAGRSYAEVERAVHEVAKDMVLKGAPAVEAAAILEASNHFNAKIKAATAVRTAKSRK
jgi:MoxR-like ATPase